MFYLTDVFCYRVYHFCSEIYRFCILLIVSSQLVMGDNQPYINTRVLFNVGLSLQFTIHLIRLIASHLIQVGLTPITANQQYTNHIFCIGNSPDSFLLGCLHYSDKAMFINKSLVDETSKTI